jgi:hypothetical protein
MDVHVSPAVPKGLKGSKRFCFRYGRFLSEPFGAHCTFASVGFLIIMLLCGQTTLRVMYRLPREGRPKGLIWITALSIERCKRLFQEGTAGNSTPRKKQAPAGGVSGRICAGRRVRREEADEFPGTEASIMAA